MAPTQGPTEPTSARRYPDLAGKRVVICEDEGLTLLQLRRVLERVGLQVVGAATTGLEAVEVVLRERPDIVLMDLTLPQMDGLEAARRILAAYPVCIVLLTGQPPEAFTAQAEAIGISGVLLKPYTSESLLPVLPQALERFCGRSQDE